MSKTAIQEIVVFKNCEDAYIGKNAQYEVYFLFFLIWLIFEHDTCHIVYDNGKSQNKNINGLKEHVKKAGSNKQQEPPEFMRKQKIQNCNNREKN
jgi:hypothetical protein